MSISHVGLCGHEFDMGDRCPTCVYSLIKAGDEVGAWLSGALSDPDVCVEMKSACDRFLKALWEVKNRRERQGIVNESIRERMADTGAVSEEKVKE